MHWLNDQQPTASWFVYKVKSLRRKCAKKCTGQGIWCAFVCECVLVEWLGLLWCWTHTHVMGISTITDLNVLSLSVAPLLTVSSLCVSLCLPCALWCAHRLRVGCWLCSGFLLIRISLGTNRQTHIVLPTAATRTIDRLLICGSSQNESILFVDNRLICFSHQADKLQMANICYAELAKCVQMCDVLICHCSSR